MSEKEYTCIICPKGCKIKALADGKIVGFKCSRGRQYVLDETQNPLRILSTIIRVKNGNISMCPVRTEKPILKEKLFEAMKLISKIEIEAPVQIGQIITNIFGTNIISTRVIEKRI